MSGNPYQQQPPYQQQGGGPPQQPGWQPGAPAFVPSWGAVPPQQQQMPLHGYNGGVPAPYDPYAAQYGAYQPPQQQQQPPQHYGYAPQAEYMPQQGYAPPGFAAAAPAPVLDPAVVAAAQERKRIEEEKRAEREAIKKKRQAEEDEREARRKEAEEAERQRQKERRKAEKAAAKKKKEEEEAAAAAAKAAECNDDDAATTDGNDEAAETDTDEPAASASTTEAATTAADEADEEEEAPRKGVKSGASKPELDSREHLNIIFIGHVDAGKSTIGGHIMYLTGQVDQRTLEKYEREAKEKNRETWYLSWALDTNIEERDKGKTVEVGRAHFTTETKRYSILDAPGHKCFVPNMISGAAQADVGVLVISARKGEFETGFDRGGQTREHAVLAKTSGVKQLVVAINKMDDSTVNWSQERYDEIVGKLKPFLKQSGYNPKTDLFFMPVSGQAGVNLKERIPEGVCPWFSGPSLLEFLDELKPMDRLADAPVRMPIVDKHKDMGVVLSGKLEAGTVRVGDSLLVMPNRTTVKVTQAFVDEEEVAGARAGDTLKLRVSNVNEDEISPGFVLCSPEAPVQTATVFDAQIMVLEYKSIICPGFTAVLHVHAASEEVTLTHLIMTLDRKTGKKLESRPRYIKQDSLVVARLRVAQPICIACYDDMPQLGRFMLRDEGITIAIGKIKKIVQ